MTEENGLAQERQVEQDQPRAEDFDRIGDLLGDVCEAAAISQPAPRPDVARPDVAGPSPVRERGRGSPLGVPASDPLSTTKRPRRKEPGTDVARAVSEAWPEVAGPEIAANASPVQLKDGRLVVSTSSSVWAHTLQYMGEDLMASLNDRLGASVVERIVFRHAGWQELGAQGPGKPCANSGVGPADGPSVLPEGGRRGVEEQSEEQREALAEVEALDLPPAVRATVIRAMEAAFARSGPVR